MQTRPEWGSVFGPIRLNGRFRPCISEIGQLAQKAGDGDRTHDNHVGNVVLYH